MNTQGDEVLLDCVGCGKQPVNAGNMGRHKFVCSTYQARKGATTVKCDGGQKRAMRMYYWAAVEDWNEVQRK